MSGTSPAMTLQDMLGVIVNALGPDVDVRFQVRDKPLSRSLVLDVHLERIAADKAGIRLVGAIGLVRGAVNSTPRTDHNLLAEDGAGGAVANCADFPGLHRNCREGIAAGTKRESRSTTGRLCRCVGCIYASEGDERPPDRAVKPHAAHCSS